MKMERHATQFQFQLIHALSFDLINIYTKHGIKKKKTRVQIHTVITAL